MPKSEERTECEEALFEMADVGAVNRSALHPSIDTYPTL